MICDGTAHLARQYMRGLGAVIPSLPQDPFAGFYNNQDEREWMLAQFMGVVDAVAAKHEHLPCDNDPNLKVDEEYLSWYQGAMEKEYQKYEEQLSKGPDKKDAQQKLQSIIEASEQVALSNWKLEGNPLAQEMFEIAWEEVGYKDAIKLFSSLAPFIRWFSQEYNDAMLGEQASAALPDAYTQSPQAQEPEQEAEAVSEAQPGEYAYSGGVPDFKAFPNHQDFADWLNVHAEALGISGGWSEELEGDGYGVALICEQPMDVAHIEGIMKYIFGGPLQAEWWPGATKFNQQGDGKAQVFVWDCDLTKSPQDDIYQAIHKYVYPYLDEGTPIRKTNKAGPGTKGTRKYESIGPYRLVWR